MALKTNEKVKMSLYPSKFKVLMSDWLNQEAQ